MVGCTAVAECLHLYNYSHCRWICEMSAWPIVRYSWPRIRQEADTLTSDTIPAGIPRFPRSSLLHLGRWWWLQPRSRPARRLHLHLRIYSLGVSLQPYIKLLLSCMRLLLSYVRLLQAHSPTEGFCCRTSDTEVHTRGSCAHINHVRNHLCALIHGDTYSRWDPL